MKIVKIVGTIVWTLVLMLASGIVTLAVAIFFFSELGLQRYDNVRVLR